jgi:glycosyltransferase involved in cell wall biosynthesis
MSKSGVHADVAGSSAGPRGRIALLMISNFGVADGGRETWAYNFIPWLLERWPNVTLDIIGLHRAGQTDNSSRVRELLRERGSITFLHSSRKRFPLLSMLRRAPNELSRSRHRAADLVIGVGSAIELLVILASPALRRAKRIVWLRTILTHERAKQLPGWLGRIAHALEIRLLRTADLLIANGEDTAVYYRQRGLEVSVIPNGVAADRWHSPPPLLSQPLRVAYIGRMVDVKGFPEFVAAAKRMHDEGKFEFHVIGEGPYDAEAARAHDEGWLIHHGPKPNSELPALVATMDVCVALTFKSSEGGGGGVSNALLEQMAAGRVIVAWDTAIYTQLLDDTNAYLVPQGDIAALERALRDIIDRPDEARRRAATAQKTAELFSFDAHLDKFTAVVEPLVAERCRS